MSLILKVVASVSLAAVALWSAASVPVTPPPHAPAWGVTTQVSRIADTLSTASALGQMIAAPSTTPGLEALIAAGRIGRIEVEDGTVESHLARVYAWRDAAPFPLLLSSTSRSLGLPFSEAPESPSGSALEATERPDLAYMAGEAIAATSKLLAIQSPGTSIMVGDASDGGGATPVALSIIRGLRSGQTLPSARLEDATGLEDVPSLADAGLMELRLSVEDDADVETIRQIKAQGSFMGLIVAEVDANALGAVEAVRAGADVIQSSRPATVFDSLSSGTRDGRIAPDRSRDASTRVLSAKVWAGLDLAPPPERAAQEGATSSAVQIRPWRPIEPSLRHRSELLEGEIARRAVTVLQAEDGPLPLVGSSLPASVFTVVLDPDADADRSLPFVNTLAVGLSPARSSYTRLGLGLEQSRYQTALEAAKDADMIVIAAFADDDGLLASRHFAVADQLLKLGRPVIWVSLGPSLLSSGLSPSRATVVGYQSSGAAQMAAAQAITGQLQVTGVLPIGIAGVASTGDGVRLAQQALRPGTPEEVGLDAAAAQRVDRVIEAAIQEGAFPGGAVAVGRDGVLLRLQGYGRLTRGGGPVTIDTPYDLASLTKVVGTTTAAMQLVEDGDLELDTEVVEYLPRYRGLGKEFVTVRQLLEHSAGHRAWYPFHANDRLDREAALDFIYADTLQYPPGTRSRYSDFDMIILGEVLEAVTDTPLDQLLAERIFEPLGMTHTGYREVNVVDRLAAPTENDSFWRGRTLQGEVHDEAASVFGGVAGHAGLFSTASDLSKFAYVLSNGGQGYGTRLFRRTTLDTFTQHVRLRSTYPTALGWMVNAGSGNSSAGSLSSRSFGHTGFTGTSIWVDPESRLFVVLLTNRVNPTRRNRRIRDVRTSLANTIAEAVRTPPGQAHTAWGFGPIPEDLATR